MADDNVLDQKLDELADLGKHWNRRRENEQSSAVIGRAMIEVVREIADLLNPKPKKKQDPDRESGWP